MQDLKRLTDQAIHQKMILTSQTERELTLLMISLIEEADRRKFYLDFGFATLYDYLTLGLKYSAGAAMRRISSARLTKEIPEIKEQILDGTLTLTNISQASQFIRNEAKHDHVMTLYEKKEVLSLIAGQSVRQAENTLIQFSSAPEQVRLKEKIKPISPTLTQVTFSASPEFMAQLEEARGLLAHKMPHATVGELLAEIMKFGLMGLKKQKFKCVEPAPESSPSSHFTSGAGNSNSNFVPAAVRRAVYERDQGRCVVIHPHNGKPCGSHMKLELDHYPLPKAMGGLSTVNNLRLTCQNCNRLHAVQAYTREKIVRYMKIRN